MLGHKCNKRYFILLHQKAHHIAERNLKDKYKWRDISSLGFGRFSVVKMSVLFRLTSIFNTFPIKITVGFL